VPKIFVASPRDVQLERMRVSWAVRRLNGEFDRTVQFDIVRWEEGFYTADRTFQVQIDAALAECEIVVAILGMRIGTPVENDFPRMPDGEPYPSGTAYEILASIASARRHGRPDVYVFFKDAATAFRVTRPDEIASAQEQWARPRRSGSAGSRRPTAARSAPTRPSTRPTPSRRRSRTCSGSGSGAGTATSLT